MIQYAIVNKYYWHIIFMESVDELEASLIVQLRLAFAGEFLWIF